MMSGCQCQVVQEKSATSLPYPPVTLGCCKFSAALLYQLPMTGRQTEERGTGTGNRKDYDYSAWD